METEVNRMETEIDRREMGNEQNDGIKIWNEIQGILSRMPAEERTRKKD